MHFHYNVKIYKREDHKFPYIADTGKIFLHRLFKIMLEQRKPPIYPIYPIKILHGIYRECTTVCVLSIHLSIGLVI